MRNHYTEAETAFMIPMNLFSLNNAITGKFT